jgi:calcium binding protein 39
MGILDFLKGKARAKPSDLLKTLSRELADLTIPCAGEFASLAQPDNVYNDLENYLAAACAGVSGNFHIKKQPKADEIDKCLAAAKEESLMLHIANGISYLKPECRRIISAVWGFLLKLESPKSFQRPLVDDLVERPEPIDILISQYGNVSRGADVTIGIMLRDASRFAHIVGYILEKDLVFHLFPVMASGNFDVSSDAFQTMRELLMNHKNISAPWLSRNFTRFFNEYMKPFVNSGEDNYVVIRQSLSILSGLLLDRQFMDSMLQFVINEEYLKSVLVLLGNDSKVVRYEAFHVFKIFAANPNKPPKIAKLLGQNKSRIVKILDHIENDRLDDIEFRQDRKAVVMKIESITKSPHTGRPDSI